MLASPSEVEFPNSRKNQHVRLYASPGTLQSDEPDFFRVVESEDEIRPAFTREDAV